jgi:tetratricopeptide (TPR) repeat protein
MKMTTWSKVAALLVVGGLLMVGCSKAATPATPPAAAEQNQRPPLSIPAQFESEQAKRDFAVKAVDDGYYEEAKKLLEETVAKEPNALAYKGLGTANYNVDDLQDAITAWNKAAELDPSAFAEMQNNIGNALRDLKKVAEAEAAYRTALSTDPTRWTAATNLAMLLKGQDRVNEAIAVLEEAVSNNKDIPPLVSLLDNLKKDASPSNG